MRDQYVATRRMIERENDRCGGVLADEMGCGKTLVTSMVLRMRLLPRTLIVVPSSLVKQWIDALQEVFASSPSVMVHDAAVSRDDAEVVLSEVRQLSHRTHIVVTTYGRAVGSEIFPSTKPPRRRHRGPYHKIAWHRVVCDEAHVLRNSKTAHFESIDALMKSSHTVLRGDRNLPSDQRCCVRWVLTGTPVHNKPADAVSLLRLVGRAPTQTTFQHVRAALRKHMLRRRLDKAKLPPLHCEDVVIVPTQEEIATMLEIAQLIQSLNVQSAEKVLELLQNAQHNPNLQCEIPQSVALGMRPWVGNIQHVIVAMLRLMQYTGCPNALRKLSSSPNEDDGFCDGSKVRATVEHALRLLRETNRGVVVFGSFVDQLRAVQAKLNALPEPVSNGLFYGELTAAQRNDLLVNQHPRVLLMQTRCGSCGLNLQAHYSNVIFMERSWNPQVDNQAVGRCYRLGQRFPVHVVHLVTANDLTVDPQYGRRLYETQQSRLDALDRRVRRLERHAKGGRSGYASDGGFVRDNDESPDDPLRQGWHQVSDPEDEDEDEDDECPYVSGEVLLDIEDRTRRLSNAKRATSLSLDQYCATVCHKKQRLADSLVDDPL